MHIPATATAMYADAGYSVPEVGQTDLDSVQYLVLGQYTSKPSYIILTELQFVHWHAGLLHETGACGEVESLQDSFTGSFSLHQHPAAIEVNCNTCWCRAIA